MRYDPKKIETKWRKKWLLAKTHEPDFKNPKKPFYNLMMFPYPSAEGLHIGSVRTFTGVDIYGRFKRMQGNDVFEPIGLDGFGIHSENYALKAGKHPLQHAKDSEKNFYRQLSEIGNGFAWAERLETYDPEYYKWTQWIFVQMFKHGLAYRKKSAVNWCPSCLTVLADEQVLSGECERCGTKVIKKDLEQWFFKITDYAERLLKNLETIDWSEPIKIAQKNWIGRSEGALIKFALKVPGQSNKHFVEVFTTRPDTLFGVTFVAVSPETAKKWLGVGWRAEQKVRDYIENTLRERGKADVEKLEKTGVFAGVVAINPSNKEEIPVWVVNYVLRDVGTGAIMAVPAHDERDFAFAKKYKLPIREAVLQKFGEKKEGAIFRDSVAAIITRPSDGKILVLYNRKSGEYEIPGGGRNTGESDQATLKREILEETGYTNFKIEEYLGQIATNFFAIGIKEERTKHQKGYHVVLLNENKIALQPDEYEDFQIYWMEPSEAIKKLDANIHGCYESEFIKRFLDRRLICFMGDGELVNSAEFSGLDTEKAKWEITKLVGGERKVQYRLRDWLISRQRYWGPPIPMIFCGSCAKAGIGGRKDMPGWHAVPEKDLPVKLPHVKDFRPTGKNESPLASVEKFYKVRCPKCKSWARRETDVSDTFLDSAWYYLRYPSIKDKKSPWDPGITKKWFPVDMYIGGAEHAVLHLLYVRFVAMALYDWGLLHFEEPFKKFRTHGLITKDGAKMSKSRGNVVNPDEYINAYGTDAVRMYLAFLAPLDQGGDFRDEGIRGLTRFLERVWKFSRNTKTQNIVYETQTMERLVHKTIKKVTEDIESFQYNTAISALMVLLNEFEKEPQNVSSEYFKIFLKLLAPFAPHISEELYQQILGSQKFRSIHSEQWPEYDPKFIKEETFELVIQVNGKVRGKISLRSGASESEARTAALSLPNVKEQVSGGPRKVIYVPNKLINFVT